ncbi:hypothetical protein [Nannocystis pusilla]|uniref:hypothetical protein n=1 Tax=Nannocystis pusilla TaxID=889268 RepID=UPI003DA2209C
MPGPSAPARTRASSGGSAAGTGGATGPGASFSTLSRTSPRSTVCPPTRSASSATATVPPDMP